MDYKKAMTAWVKEVVKWQLENPDKDWLTELCNIQSSGDDGGSNPPQPPPPPPGTGG